MKKKYSYFLTLIALIIFLFGSTIKTSAQVTKVVIASNFQSELGCTQDQVPVGGDWEPNCDNTALTYNSTSGKWEGTFNIPAGCWEYKVAINGSWSESYGLNGGPSNIPLTISSATLVTFTYDPITHIVNTPYDYPCYPPNTVVIVGSFQSELGCAPVTYITGDWEPGCDNTRLTYDPDSKLWIGTFNIPAGYWEYKVAYNNNWDENYGAGGIRDGANIPLDLCVPTQVKFKYNYATHLVALEFSSLAICVTKFYDANVNGINDEGMPIGGVKFTLSGNSNAVQYTDGNGNTTFSGLTTGNYTVTETLLSNWAATTPVSQSLVLNSQAHLYFGNVCLGAGGGHGIGYWASKNGQDKMTSMGMENELWWMRYLSLRNADGSDFDPYTYTEFRNWLQKANAKNMTYMLSAQMAAMFLNFNAGFVNYSSIVYTPGCGYMGNNNFMYVYSLAWDANYYLMSISSSLAKDPTRSYFECLKNGLDKANNNLNFVQPYPCGTNTETSSKQNSDLGIAIISPETEARVWPNPTTNYFILRPSDLGNNKLIKFKVFDVNGRQVYTATGSSNKDYHFGERFIPGIYMIELIQGDARKTVKVIKQ